MRFVHRQHLEVRLEAGVGLYLFDKAGAVVVAGASVTARSARYILACTSLLSADVRASSATKLEKVVLPGNALGLPTGTRSTPGVLRILSSRPRKAVDGYETCHQQRVMNGEQVGLDNRAHVDQPPGVRKNVQPKASRHPSARVAG